MTHTPPPDASRRDFLKDTGRLAAVSAVAALTPRLYAADDATIQVALVGCGGRGSGAAANALSVTRGPTRLVAMADIFPERLQSSHANLSKQYAARMDVPEDRRFLGFDAYRRAMDCLRPGDVVILATPPAFRWVHFTYAIARRLHVFMEKPVTVDGPTSRRMLELAAQSRAQGLKVGVGLMSRHSRALQELQQRIADGEIGELVLQRAYRMAGPIGFFASLPKPPDISDLLYQVKRFHSFLWAGGGCYSDFYIHLIDHQCWMKNAWPVSAQAVGGRHYKSSPEGQPYVDQNFDSYAVEYTYADGATFLLEGRCIEGAERIYHSYAHGTKGSAVVSKSGDCGLPSSTYRGQRPDRGRQIWESRVRPQERNPYQNEWNDLVDAIRDDRPYNEVERGVRASLVTSMGRMAAHTGRIVTYETMLNCPHEMAPGLDRLTADSPAPLHADAQGRYPVPRPGIVTDREY